MILDSGLLFLATLYMRVRVRMHMHTVCQQIQYTHL